MGFPSWPFLAWTHIHKLVSTGKLQISAPITSCQRNVHLLNVMRKACVGCFVLCGTRRQNAWCFCTCHSAARQRLMVTCWMGYNIIEIRPNSLEHIVAIMYGMSSQSACSILGAAAREQYWVFGRGYNLRGFFQIVLKWTNIDTCLVCLLLTVLSVELLACRRNVGEAILLPNGLNKIVKDTL